MRNSTVYSLRTQPAYRFHAMLLMLLVMTGSIVAAQTKFAFKFGNGKRIKGYTSITPRSLYSEQTGYGFTGSTEPVVWGGSGRNALTASCITASAPLYFSVRLPEGNYDVQLLLGDANGPSATTVRAECRRLFVENCRTNAGETKQVQFTVHLRDSLIRDANDNITGRVKLKPREHFYLHWDNMLTIEFSDSLPKICALTITPNRKATTLFLAGNSTVVDQDKEPWAAWGQMLPRFLKPTEAAVANYAESGETMRAFSGERRLEKIWSMAKAGDYLFIEFAHNDQKPGSTHLDAFTTYKQTLKEWIREARNRKMVPVLVTSMNRRSFDSSGHIINTLEGFPEAMRQTAAEESVYLIDLNAMSKTLYEAWGPDESKKAFVHYAANSFPNQPAALQDNTHFNPYGAYQLAACVVSSIRQQHLPLEKLIRADIPPFNPAAPPSAASFYWPRSMLQASSKPDGN